MKTLTKSINIGTKQKKNLTSLYMGYIILIARKVLYSKTKGQGVEDVIEELDLPEEKLKDIDRG